MSKTLLLIPTYNEADNVKALYNEIKKLGLNLDILFVDDNSPDGTASIVKQIVSMDKSVKLLKRQGKEGIGSAHLAGINWAYQKDYDTLITMDADFTHKPEDILRFLTYANRANVIVGSRYLKSNSLSDWNILRKSLTNMAHFATTTVLSMPYDATSAFRLYNLNKIPQTLFGLIESKGYSFFFESLFILYLNNFKIREVSIALPARTYGTSKMTLSDAWRSLIFLFQTFYLSKIYKDSYIYAPPALPQKKLNVQGEDEWDKYWKTERKKRKILYDALAVFYRKYIIKKTLNYYIKENFKRGAKMLHAGCGGGQVDEDVVNLVKVTALDISIEALNRYKQLYGDRCEVVHGSILNIPAKNKTFDGVYNLGVMEHFTRKDIKIILDEFHRILKDDGKILLFWPPRFGLSVIFLNTIHYILNSILRKNIRLHPHEITKVESKRQIEKIMEESRFKLKSINFGPRDAFTYAIIIAEKVVS